MLFLWQTRTYQVKVQPSGHYSKTFPKTLERSRKALLKINEQPTKPDIITGSTKSTTWNVNSCATSHMCNNRSFSETSYEGIKEKSHVVDEKIFQAKGIFNGMLYFKL